MSTSDHATAHRYQHVVASVLFAIVFVGTIFTSYQVSRGEIPPVVEEAGDDDFSVSGASLVEDLATVTFAPLGSAVTPKTLEAQSSATIQQNTSGPFVPSALLKTIVYPFPSVSSTSTTSSSFFSISSTSSASIAPHPAPGPFGSSVSSSSSSVSNQSSSFLFLIPVSLVQLVFTQPPLGHSLFLR